ncbi:hypothetical protein BJI69_05070 [Luteibacter rhizovicinus DSM 16549]|uniref:Uncharacterized protein n=1 Tax=Luteibacter rhizovicinus DSM 16549 TaxID=1440763 RepID=A0A0G9HJC4_9GAMM|nr:hypothetical protein [Luteibacter rhizovicinus]APG03345.1 hypothetical protein BJI69_05070 [Luteibacter rhizovicinus DSM 16549]KLD67777.1 hypothetical protein Y883_06340 [Luteibacter rhizovicinus DSM 16549]KLD79389.1 hypothetical protein Y886_04700 [Xanthomonas hyacinthi DSM 19077]
MKFLLRLACLTALLPAPAFAADPTTFNVYRELVRHRTATMGVDKAFDHNTRKYVSRFLENPDSPYSALRNDPPITNEVWWYDFADSLPIDTADKSAAALEMLQWQSGFTKARIGVDVVVDRASVVAYRNGYAAANAIKAGVDADILWKARDLNGALSTLAAGHAVALQLLRDQVRSNAPETHEARGIKADVLARYLKEENPGYLTESDQAYLADLLSFALTDNGFTIDSKGRRQLPAAYRVARVAAAYADAGSYLSPKGYCVGNDPRPGLSTQSDAITFEAPLCFVAATDRAVQSWFRHKMRQEEANVRRAHASPDESERLTHFWFTAVLALIDIAAFVEFAEADFVSELSAEGALAEEEAAVVEERATQLSCRVRP